MRRDAHALEPRNRIVFVDGKIGHPQSDAVAETAALVGAAHAHRYVCTNAKLVRIDSALEEEPPHGA